MNYDRYSCDGDCETCPPNCPLSQSCGGTWEPPDDYCSDDED